MGDAPTTMIIAQSRHVAEKIYMIRKEMAGQRLRTGTLQGWPSFVEGNGWTLAF
jgi:hypothetical protein